jgi:DNA-binding NtrC family response regulator
MALLRQRIARISTADATVLIQGETGTGKELAARAIHYQSGRRNHPFVPVNCGALPENLAENELFGHERGAYTDARQAASGLIADAEGGTLFLDEIEAMSARIQVILLRFLQDCVYRPLGSRRSMRGNVRIVAASNVSIAKLAHQGRFREDLMYRLRIMTLDLPPLRERSGDVPLLAEYFMRKLALQYRVDEKRISPRLMAALRDYAWPGNVRELENLLHRAFLYSESGELQLEDADVPAFGGYQSADHAGSGECPLLLFNTAKDFAIAEFEREYLKRALARAGGNVSAAARAAGKERRAFGKLLKKYGIDRRDSFANVQVPTP